WVPGGNYPGASSCDSAVDASGNPITITVDSAIPNNLNNLIFNCPSCVIDIVPGGHLTVDGNGSLAGGAILKLNGGTFTVNSAPGAFTIGAGSELELNSG